MHIRRDQCNFIKIPQVLHALAHYNARHPVRLPFSTRSQISALYCNAVDMT
jgi:hypothetical protein